MTTDHEATARKLFHEIQCDDEVYSVRKIAAALAEAWNAVGHLVSERYTLRAKLATVEHNNSWLNDEYKKLKAERDAANVRVKELTKTLDWRKGRENFHATFNGGHHDKIPHEAFHHGMDTVFNALDKWSDAIATDLALARSDAHIKNDADFVRGMERAKGIVLRFDVEGGIFSGLLTRIGDAIVYEIAKAGKP